MNSKVHKNIPQSIPELKVEIIRVINDVEPKFCQKVIINLIERVGVCKASKKAINAIADTSNTHKKFFETKIIVFNHFQKYLCN